MSKTLWNDFIGPDTNFDECCKFFNGQFKESKNSIFFSKPLNDFTEIKVWFSTDKKKLDTIELAIIEHAELVGQYDFKETNPHNAVKQAYTLLVKWLFDRQYLLLDKSVYAAGLSQNHAEVLVFTKTHLRNHIWDNQIVSEPDLRSFLFKIKSNGTVNLANGEKVSMYIRNLFMQAAGLWQKHQDLYENESMDQVVALENSTHLDEKQSQEFFKLLDVNLEMITKIGLAPLNW